MLWVDKHRPKSLDDLDLHPSITSNLMHLADSGDMPHLLFYGPSGSGKKTRVMATLHRVFGPGVLNVKLEHKTMQVTDSKSIDLTTLSSPFHIDLNPSDAGNYDRVVVMQMIREIAQTAPMTSIMASMNQAAQQQTQEKATGVAAVKAPPPKFKVVVLNEVDRMTRGAQQALRRTMEKYMTTCRLVLICNSTSRLIPPLRSRCLGIRVPSHNQANTVKAVEKICAKEDLSVPSQAFLTTLHTRSSGNLRRALLMFEAAKMNRCDLSGNGQDIPQADWSLYLDEIVSDILREQTPKKLHDIRLKLYELLGQCVPNDVIMNRLVSGLLLAVPPIMRRELIEIAAKFDHQMKLGTKSIIHLEAFVANVMKLIKSSPVVTSL